MNTRPESSVPQEWLNPEFIQQIANAYYTGDPLETETPDDDAPSGNRASLGSDVSPERNMAAFRSEYAPISLEKPTVGEKDAEPANDEERGNIADFTTPSVRERHQTRHLYFLEASDPEQPSGEKPAASHKPSSGANFHGEQIRQDFPILHQEVNGKPLIWLDNAATTQKPQAVIDAVSHFYECDNSNIHRGVHTLADRATEAYERARERVSDFIGAKDSQEIVFVRGTTEGINLVANSYGRSYLRRGDEILVSIMEHHANIVPWQMLCEETGAVLRVIPMNDVGEILLDEYAALLNPRTKLVALTQVSNVLGTVNPVLAMTQMAHAAGARVLIDGAQSIPHCPVDMQAIDCDFFVFSGHKLFAPTGIGVLYGKAEVLDSMPPWQGGGNMIQDVTFEQTTYNSLPHKFEAGTGNIADAVGLGAAIDYLSNIGFHAAMQYEASVLAYAMKTLADIPGLRLIGTAPHKVSVLSFVLDGFPDDEVGRRLDREGIAVRSGHHCAQPVLRRLGLESTVRPSLALYNTIEEVDALAEAIIMIQESAE